MGEGCCKVCGDYLKDKSWIRPCQTVRVFGLLGTPPLPSNLISELLQDANKYCNITETAIFNIKCSCKKKKKKEVSI